ncbi:hypothetical protein RMSM_05777 [Rhodopirellula maiorica SM1]|uniref:Uncharacterized protein n=1 Tax=Rhodopirellula maiorica SM1 TaxID=1265738 RepID=M5RD61_9BACT|nr:hypothetical protein RMSM_05777 [Rhodopirellula maiorica SM1]
MCQVGLESERFRHPNGFEQIEDVFPAVHSGPADFAFGRQTLAVIGRDLGSFFERVGNFLRVGLRVFTPLFDTKLGAIDADCSVLTHTVVVKDSGDTASHLHRREELGLLLGIAHSRIANGTGPNRSDQRTDRQTFAGDQIRNLANLVVAGFGIGVWQEQKVVDAIELLSVDFGRSGQVEHSLEADRWLLPFVGAFANQTGPHCIMKFHRFDFLKEFV